MTREQEEFLTKTFTDALKKTHRNAMAQGAHAICAVIGDMAEDASLSAEERVEKIKRFCRTSLAKPETNPDETAKEETK